MMKRLFSSLSAQTLTAFSRQLATLLSAGIPLVHALEIIAKNSRRPLETLLQEIRTAVLNGTPLAEAFKQHPHYFDTLACQLVATGELTGMLDKTLTQWATYQEKALVLKKRFQKALRYPSLVFVVACLVLTLLLTFLIPQFEQLFIALNAELPGFTQRLLRVSHWLKKEGAAWALGIGVMTIGLSYASKTFLKTFFDTLLFQLPLFGSFCKKLFALRLLQVLSLALTTGISLVRALESAKTCHTNRHYCQVLQQLQEGIHYGTPFYIAMRQTGFFSDYLVQMVAVGEEAGTLESLLAKMATSLEEELMLSLEKGVHLLEPLLILLIGAGGGSLIIAMYLPIFKMGALF